MEGKLKRIRFNKDGTLDFDIETEDGKRAIVEGCSLHVDKNNEPTYMTYDSSEIEKHEYGKD
jgi:hypothetical protein